MRGAEHLRDFKNARPNSAMYKHKQNEHGGEDIKIGMEITKQFCDPLTRQADEAVRISKRTKSEILNSKNEFNHPPIARITVERKKKTESGHTAAQPILLPSSQ